MTRTAMVKTQLLGTLSKGQKGIIVSVGGGPMHTPSNRTKVIERLLEMGLIEGSCVEILHEAPFGKDPIAVRVRGSILGLRREEANYVEVEETSR